MARTKKIKTIDSIEIVPSENVKSNSVQTTNYNLAVINPRDINSIETFGDKYSNVLSGLSNSLQIDDTKLKALGEIGTNVTSLMGTVQSLNPAMITEKPSFFGRLFGNAKNGITKFIDSQKSVEEAVVKIQEKLLTDRFTLIKENENLEKVYTDNLSALNDMSDLIQNGLKDLEVLKSTLNNLKANQNPTDEEILEIQKQQHFIERFEQKLSRLNNGKALVVRQLPQIRIMQAGNSTEIDTIKDVVDVSIPLWKSQIGLFISQLKTKNALETRQAVTSMINETIQRNAELMNQNTQAIANGYSSDVITVETIQTIQTNLISSIETMKNATEQAQLKRKESFIAIANMDSELKQLQLK